MIIHIVRPNETIERIANSYHCEISDITSENQHITDFKHLASGTKLRIPFLTKDVMETLEETESFISDYYPTYNGALNGLKPEKENPNSGSMEEAEKPIETPKEDSFVPLSKEAAKTPVIKVEEKAVEREIRKPLLPNYIPFYSGYQGNIEPRMNPKFIRKI